MKLIVFEGVVQLQEAGRAACLMASDNNSEHVGEQRPTKANCKFAL